MFIPHALDLDRRIDCIWNFPAESDLEYPTALSIPRTTSKYPAYRTERRFAGHGVLGAGSSVHASIERAGLVRRPLVFLFPSRRKAISGFRLGLASHSGIDDDTKPACMLSLSCFSDLAGRRQCDVGVVARSS